MAQPAMDNEVASSKGTTESVVAMQSLVVTAEREPGNFVLTDREVTLTQAADLSHLLSHQSMVAVGGGSPVAQKIYVRGFEDTLLNVVVDGAQQAGELYHHQGRVQLEPEFIKAIELDAGAGAATNGPGALTGALRVTTKTAFDLLRSNQSVGALVKGTVGLNGQDSYKATASIYGKMNEQFGLAVGYVHQEGENYEDGSGRLVSPTGFEHQRGYAKLTGRLGASEMNLSYERIHDSGTYYERPHLSNYTGTFVLSDHELNRETLSYTHRYDPVSEAVDVSGTLFLTSTDFENRRNTTGLLYGRGEFSSWGYDLRNTARLAGHAVTVGTDFRADDAFGRQQATPPPFWGGSDQIARVAGVYAQDQWRMHPSLRATAGLRFDAYHHEVENGVGAGARNHDLGLSPNVGLEWEALQGLTLRASYAQAFRGITIREAFFSGLYQHRGDLESERADNLEAGFSYERGGLFARATVFRQKIENYIDAIYLGTTVWGVWGNVGDAEVEGYEAEAGHRWGAFELAAGVWEADNSLNGSPLTDANLGLGTSIGRTWTMRADYDWAAQRVTTGLRARLVQDEPTHLANRSLEKDGYTVVDLHASWQPFASRQVTLAASVTNLFDEFYYDHATYSYNAAGRLLGFPAKGREFVLSATYTF